jgi:hypothetical protein
MNAKVYFKLSTATFLTVIILALSVSPTYARTAIVAGIDSNDHYTPQEDSCSEEIRQLFLNLANQVGYNPIDYHNNPNLERFYAIAFRENRSIIWCNTHGNRESFTGAGLTYDGYYNHVYFLQTKQLRVYDDQVWRHSEKGKMRFVFMWSCHPADLIGSLGTLPNGTTVEVGFPLAWSRINDISDDGYANPSNSNFCFIGFLNTGPRLTSNYTKDDCNITWVGYKFTKAFWQAAFSGKTIKQALDEASQTVFGVKLFSQCPFYKGDYFDDGLLYVKMIVYGNANIEITSKLPTDIPNGDLNWNGELDAVDMGIIYSELGSHEGDEHWNPACDLNGDGKINYLDLSLWYGYFLGDHTYFTYAPPIQIETTASFGKFIEQTKQKYP